MRCNVLDDTGLAPLDQVVTQPVQLRQPHPRLQLQIHTHDTSDWRVSTPSFEIKRPKPLGPRTRSSRKERYL